MSLLADQRKQELLESVRTVSQHMQRGYPDMNYANAINARNRKAMSGGQFQHDNALPADDLDFLDSYEGEELIREEEEELLRDGCTELVNAEDFWKALNREPGFAAIKRSVINKIMGGEDWKQAAREHLEAEAKKRMEP